jgi:type IV pilus assembly protein PilA
MNGLLVRQLIANIKLDKNRNGFTLIELLVVIIILAILALVSYPALFGQIAKARESEAKINLGAISRSQQAYYLEAGIFADTIDNLQNTASIESSYYNFPSPTVADVNKVKHQAIAKNPNLDQTRNYASGTYFNSGAFAASLCQSFDVEQSVDVSDTYDGACTNSGRKIE